MGRCTFRAVRVHVTTRVAGAFGENGYLLYEQDAASAIIIDPGAQADALAEDLERLGLTLAAILLTHAHLDHVEGVARLVARTGAQTWLHPGDGPLYDHVVQQGVQFGLHIDPQPPIDHPLADGQPLRFGNIEIEVRHVPGHSPGHVLFHLPAAGVAFVGDVVFQGSIGRSDLPGGNFQQLIASIRTHVLTLPAETVLYPGHGEHTTVAHEAATNPFLIPHFGGGFA